jgi:hypothetical protein
MLNSTDLYNDAFTTMTTIPIPTTSREIHAAADEKTAATGIVTPAEASMTTTPAATTAGSATETATHKSAVPNTTDRRGTKTLTEAREGAITIATAALTTPETTALDVARPHLPLKPGSCASSRRTKIWRWRTC